MRSRNLHLVKPNPMHVVRPARLATVHSIAAESRDRFGLWSMWLLLGSSSLWMMSLTDLSRGSRFLISMLLAVTFVAVFEKVLPTRRDGRVLPHRLSALFLVLGSIASALYLWVH